MPGVHCSWTLIFFVMEVSSKDFSVHECHNQVVFKVGLVTFGGWFEKG